jgi:hypothetical protein
MTAMHHEESGTSKKIPEFCHICLGVDDLERETPGPVRVALFFRASQGVKDNDS